MDGFVKSSAGKARKIMRNKAYFGVRRSDEGCSATQHPDFLRSRQKLKSTTTRLSQIARTFFTTT